MSVYVIPVVAIVFGIGIAMLGIWTEHQRKSQILAQLHRERMAAIEKGIELPPMQLDVVNNAQTASDKVNPARVLRIGVLLLTIGIVLYFAIDAAGGREGALFGLLPATLGLANLVYAAVLFSNERKAAEERANNRLLPPPL